MISLSSAKLARCLIIPLALSCNQPNQACHWPSTFSLLHRNYGRAVIVRPFCVCECMLVRWGVSHHSGFVSTLEQGIYTGCNFTKQCNQERLKQSALTDLAANTFCGSWLELTQICPLHVLIRAKNASWGVLTPAIGCSHRYT